MRSALANLEHTGFIDRRWGVGTFVAKNPSTYNNLSINSGVTQLIRSSGEEPGSIEMLLVTRPASERVSTHLSIELGTPTLVLERVRTSNDVRVVFTVDCLPLSLFRLPDGEIPLDEINNFLREHHSFYDYLYQQLSMEIHHGLAWIRPCFAGDHIAEKLPSAATAIYCTSNKWITLQTENLWPFLMNIMQQMPSGFISTDPLKESYHEY